MPRAKWQKNPYKKTKEVLGKIEDILKIDGTIEEASYYAGINPETYYRWVKEDPELSNRFQKARQYPFILARKTLMKGIQKEDTKAAIEYLKRRDKRYHDKSENTNRNTNEEVSKEELDMINDVLEHNDE